MDRSVQLDRSILLLRQFQEGDEDALNELLKRYGMRILMSVRSRLGPGLRTKVQSMDIVQEVLAEAISGLQDFEPQSEGALAHWFSTLAANRIRDKADYFKAEKRSVLKEIPLESMGPTDSDGEPSGAEIQGPDKSPSGELILSEEVKRVEGILDSLAEDDQEVIRLRDFDGLEFSEIGEKMSRSPDAARMLYHRAVERLATKYEELSGTG